MRFFVSLKHCVFLFFLILLGMAVESSAKFVAVLETSVQDALLSLPERQYLTDVFRSEAVRELPAEQNFTIMTRENITAMLPPGKSLEECEGSCLAETGKNIAADYVAQARITKVGGSLALSAEIYETAGNKLVASFNGRGNNVDELEAIIRENSQDFFKKVKGSGNSWSGVSGFGDFSSTGSFSVGGKKSFIVTVSSNPSGASLSIDGRPVPKCPSTPCQVQVEEGEHRFVLVKERYEDGEVVKNVTGNGDEVSVELPAAFGALVLNPRMADGVGSENDLRMTIDEKKARVGRNELEPGIHQVRITHPCYDPVEFKVGIEKRKEETFDQPLVRGIGGLSLSAEWRGEAQAVPVYIDGIDAGSTPFLGEVPMCSQVSVGSAESFELVKVNLKWHETVEYTHKMRYKPEAAAMREERKADEIRARANAAYARLDAEDDDEVDYGSASYASVRRYDEGKSIPTGIDDVEKSSQEGGINWLPVGISAAVAVTGTVLAVVGEMNASSTRNKVPEDGDEFKKNKDDIHQWQTMRMAGIITAIVGAVGIGVSFAF